MVKKKGAKTRHKRKRWVYLFAAAGNKVYHSEEMRSVRSISSLKKFLRKHYPTADTIIVEDRGRR